MVLWLRSAYDADLRVGVVASRKVGGAVQRNRARRRLRELYRRNRHRLSGKYDVVLVARRDLVKARWGELVEEFVELAGQAGLLGETTRGGG
jgi:ribonuclease P protein component